MTKVMRVQRISLAKSGLPKDNIVNTFYFHRVTGSGPILVGEANSVMAELDTFFNTAVGGGNAVRNYTAEITMAATRTLHKCYDMDDVPKRVPIFTANGANPTPALTTQALPSECCCCLSFAGPQLSGTPQGRRRGRVYIGPLNVVSIAPDANTQQAVIDPLMRTALTAAANRMHDNLLALATPWEWVVYSPTTRASVGGAAELAITPITTAWVDDAPDVQRRRGQDAKTRTTLAL